MALDGVGGLEINCILSKLDPREAATVACVSKRYRDLASDDLLWSKFCSDELDLSSPEDPDGNPCPNFMCTYRLWREAFNMYPWPLVVRVKRCWGKLKSWLSGNFPEALSTLRKGASEDEIKDVENCLKVKLPLPTRVLYRFCDGQELGEDCGGSVPGSPLGLIGGYTFYEHIVNVYLLPLSELIVETKDIINQLGFSRRSKFVVVALSSTHRGKIFFLNCVDGQLHVGTRNLPTDGEMIPCVPKELLNSVHDVGGRGHQDAMLLWLEEHGRRLESGIVKLRGEGKMRSINQFPEGAPGCTTAVTNGIQVRASAVLVPEYCDLQNESEKYLFAYSIRMSLLPQGCIINGASFPSCQLYSRHWVIRANDTVVSNVNGEAVIGKYPLLRPGEKEFVYESCAPLPSSGSVEGYFTFVPGSLADPRGDMFEVQVARFPLQLPDYIF